MSEVKVNKISPRSGTTVTLGDSGDTFTIPSGATINNQGTATNFGATGSASWNTTVKTSGFTAVAGEGYFVNTTGGAVSVNLPAGTAGAVVAIKDYAGTFDTNAVTLVQNGSDKIGGSTVNATLDVEGVAVTLVFVDSTQGWLVTDSGLQEEAPTAQYIIATGGTITCSGDFKIHTFTSPGTFTVSQAGNASGSNTVDYLVVGGGGGAGVNGNCGPNGASGAGAGGFRVSNGYGSPAPLMSPLASPTALPVGATGYPVTVGAGGAANCGSPYYGNPGNPSTFAGTTTITSAGGGFGSGNQDKATVPGSGGPGGSGGGGHQVSPGGNQTGAGNTPPVSPPQGNPGSTGSSPSGEGGGGAGAAGINSGWCGVPTNAGKGGAGSYIIQAGFGGCNGTTGPVGSTRYFAGGGGGSSSPGRSPGGVPGPGGAGGGGPGGVSPTPAPNQQGVANTGGGGGATSCSPGEVGNGGSGIVIIRYKFQN